jgi:phosphohistidine phosphatase
MTRLWLMRHCEPKTGLPMDGARSLTANGVKQAEQQAAFMVREIGRVDYVVTSDFARAMETAAIMAKALGSQPMATSRLLEPNGTPAEMWAEVERLALDSQDVLVVGHDPSINALLFWLLGMEIDTGDDATGMIRFDHGSIAHLKGETESMRLHWFVTPSLVARDEDEEAVLEAARALAVL